MAFLFAYKNFAEYTSEQSNGVIVKLSISEPNEARYRILERDNEELRRQVETLKSEMTLTKGHKVNPQVVRKQVNRLLREYSSEADADEIYNRVYEIYDYISNDKAGNRRY